MARLMVTYKTPKDAGGFDAYYFNTHVPPACPPLCASKRTVPGIRRCPSHAREAACPRRSLPTHTKPV
jgi:hypothetical protein